MKRIANLLNSDRGASAVLIAISMVVLLGFSAVAIDAAGIGFNERRQDQSAADVGALTAVQFAVTQNLGNGCSGSLINIARCNGASEAIEVANLTLDNPALADWSDATKCGSPPPGYTVSPISDCVAFNANNQRAWVRIPTIDNPTTIGRAVGLNLISSSADAIAGASVIPPGGVLPFLLPGSAASADYECLKAFANPKFGPCSDGPISGNFGSADFFLYGDVDKGWTEKCTGDTNGRLVANIARGVDHPLSTHPTGIGTGVEEQPNCPLYSAQPNITDSQTGVGNNLEDGMLFGGSSYSPSPYPGRIQDGSGYTVRNSGGPNPAAIVDDVPIWDFLVDDSVDATLSGTPCDDDDIQSATPDMRPALMEVCINWAKLNTKEIFDNNLAGSIRFGWVPQIWENTFSGNPYYIKLFRPVYLDTTWFGCNASSCDIMYTPDVPDTGSCPVSPVETRITCGTPGSHNKGLQAVTAWLLDESIVPDNAKSPAPGSANQRTFNLID